MRKIEQAMIEAINSRKSVNLGNTEVKVLNDLILVSLFDNVIATINPSKNKLHICNCGYVTATTASRLQAIVSTFGGGKITRRKGVMSFNGQPFTLGLTIKF